MKRLKGGLAAAAILAVGLAMAPGAGAVGYQAAEFVGEGAGLPVGVAVDQSNGDVYVAEFGQFDGSSISPGSIARFDSSGVPLSPATFGSGYFVGVAVDSQGGDVYGSTRPFGADPAGILGFDELGVALGAPFPIGIASTFSQIATDEAGNIYWPNTNESIVVFDSSTGNVAQTITCSSCPEPASLLNAGSVALDSAGNIYVADIGHERVVKFDPQGDSDPTPPSVFYEGASAAVAVDPVTGDVFVSGNDGGGFQITPLDSAGNPRGPAFGLGLLQNGLGAFVGPQLAVDGNTGALYASDTTATLDDGYLIKFVPAAAPSAVTGTATAIASAGATLNGTVNPNGAGDISSCHFEYGPTASYGSSVPCASNPPNSEDPEPVSASISGLDPSSSYHFKLVAEGPGGEVEGTDASFETLPNKPTVTTGAATGITQTAATMHATLDAEGDDATCKFEYGTTAAYGQTAACSISPVTGTAATAVSAALSGLSAGTSYHFRVVATNKGGVTNGNDMVFTTLAAPSLPASPTGGGSTPAPPPTPPVVKKPLKCKKGFKKKTVKGKRKCVKVKKKKHKKN